MAPPVSKRQTSCRKRSAVLTSTLPSLTTEGAMSLSSKFSAAPSGPAVSTGRTEVAAHQVFWVLRVGFTVLPIVFGLDKFTNLLADWTRYLAPQIDDLVPGTAHQAMLAGGGGEIVAGL